MGAARWASVAALGADGCSVNLVEYARMMRLWADIVTVTMLGNLDVEVISAPAWRARKTGVPGEGAREHQRSGA